MKTSGLDDVELLNSPILGRVRILESLWKVKFKSPFWWEEWVTGIIEKVGRLDNMKSWPNLTNKIFYFHMLKMLQVPLSLSIGEWLTSTYKRNRKKLEFKRLKTLFDNQLCVIFVGYLMAKFLCLQPSFLDELS